MKLKLRCLTIYLILVFIFVLIIIGLAFDNSVIEFSVLFIFGLLSSHFLLLSVTTFTRLIILYFKSKKKIKDKRIKLKVVFIRKHDATETTFTRIFSYDTLTDCVMHALEHCKTYSCQIKSMEQLTTEE